MTFDSQLVESIAQILHTWRWLGRGKWRSAAQGPGRQRCLDVATGGTVFVPCCRCKGCSEVQRNVPNLWLASDSLFDVEQYFNLVHLKMVLFMFSLRQPGINRTTSFCVPCSGRRPSYRNVLLQVRKKLQIPCSGDLSTEDIESEIFLHLLQQYSPGYAPLRSFCSLKVS